MRHWTRLSVDVFSIAMLAYAIYLHTGLLHGYLLVGAGLTGLLSVFALRGDRPINWIEKAMSVTSLMITVLGTLHLLSLYHVIPYAIY